MSSRTRYQSVCGCCGASKETRYQHHEDCLINLPGRFEVLYRHWRHGKRAFARDGESALNKRLFGGTKELREHESAYDVAYLMGVRTAMQLGAASRFAAASKQTLRDRVYH